MDVVTGVLFLAGLAVEEAAGALAAGVWAPHLAAAAVTVTAALAARTAYPRLRTVYPRLRMRVSGWTRARVVPLLLTCPDAVRMPYPDGHPDTPGHPVRGGL